MVWQEEEWDEQQFPMMMARTSVYLYLCLRAVPVNHLAAVDVSAFRRALRTLFAERECLQQLANVPMSYNSLLPAINVAHDVFSLAELWGVNTRLLIALNTPLSTSGIGAGTIDRQGPVFGRLSAVGLGLAL